MVSSRKPYAECRVLPAATSEDVKIASVGIALQALLNHKSQALHAATHIGVAGGEKDPDTARNRDHCRLSSSSTRSSASTSTSRSTRTRQPPPSSISIIPTLAIGAGADDGSCGAGDGAEEISTGIRAGPVS